MPVAVAVCLTTAFNPALAQTVESPWYDIPLPPTFEAHNLPAIAGTRGPAPAVVPEGEEQYVELAGQRLLQDLRAIIEFSHQSRQQQELGGNQMWGRVSGFPSGKASADWAAQQFRDAGIDQVETQTFTQNQDASLWLPVQWEVRLIGNNIAGAGSKDVVLTTAVALAPSQIPDGTLEAPLIYVGTARPAELAHMDVSGKIAIQHITPQAHLVFERSAAVPRAQDLMARGAVAVLNIIDQPGNEMARDLANCGGPCFNIGGRDGVFLGNVMDAAATRGHDGQLSARLSLQTSEHSGLTGYNVVAVVPGASEESIVVNAHLDAWYDGAGDNGDGVAVLMALARHFGQRQVELERTLVLIASAGHHTTGLNGPRNAVSMNPDLFDNSVLIFNLEHVAQRNFSPARSVLPDGYREFIADSGEAPIVAGITNSSPFLQDLFNEGVQRYGTNFVSGNSTMASGEGGGYRDAGKPIVTTMQAPPLYHTSGEVAEAISVPGMERMARFMAWFIKQVARAPNSEINP
ncbi:hypothetical protein PHACT_02490 [Pseudohongiella acticola]|uniref:Peptidase M28 domain-containing protein n=2 Tax=Pseudohongiella acticola TaxID=1524254 RepID=A0A1E8CIB8_9GAMM|nr:hypothetical protein PHACT_02490 [Pseudohongiella acticola]